MHHALSGVLASLVGREAVLFTASNIPPLASQEPGKSKMDLEGQPCTDTDPGSSTSSAGYRHRVLLITASTPYQQ